MKYEEHAASIGSLVDKKNRAYGDSFNQSYRILNVLYPSGVRLDQYKDMLAMIRVIDKLFRIATGKEALGEDPWKDIAGYAILASLKEPYCQPKEK